jgi:branched-subunit amino acid aminotransferase/4-amino-4-deoxychorismate lyase
MSQIWVRGRVIPDESLRISVLDRTFEHGIGLFETLRTWNSHATLLARHLERMKRSAVELDLPLHEDDLPDLDAVRDLIEANRGSLRPGQDVRLRLTLSGGIVSATDSRSVLWMTAAPLPALSDERGAVITQRLEVDLNDPLARHKSLNYWHKRIAHARAMEEGSDEVLCVADGMIWEATRSNIFVVEGRRLLTPGLDGPLLPGVMRRLVVEQAASLGLEINEGALPLKRVRSVDEAFLTNSVRGVWPIVRLMNRELPAPGPVTRHLWHEVLPWLESGGKTI